MGIPGSVISGKVVPLWACGSYRHVTVTARLSLPFRLSAASRARVSFNTQELRVAGLFTEHHLADSPLAHLAPGLPLRA